MHQMRNPQICCLLPACVLDRRRDEAAGWGVNRRNEYHHRCVVCFTPCIFICFFQVGITPRRGLGKGVTGTLCSMSIHCRVGSLPTHLPLPRDCTYSLAYDGRSQGFLITTSLLQVCPPNRIPASAGFYQPACSGVTVDCTSCCRCFCCEMAVVARLMMTDECSM